MFDFVKNRRIVVGVIIGLLSIPFAFFGIDFYFRGGSGGDQVASVAGAKISEREYSEALRQRQEQLRRATQGQVDASLLDSPEVRRGVLEQLVDERVMYAAALKAGITVTDAELQAMIADIPAFREGGGSGKFSPALYQAALRAEGMSERQFEGMLRKDLIVNLVRQSVATTAFVPTAVMDRLYRLRVQEREVSQQVLAPEQFAAKVQIAPEALKAYYDANQEHFKLPEKVRVQYAILTLEGIQRRVTLAPEQVEKYYEERRAQFEKAEERRASHILISVPGNATPEQKAKAREKAEALLAQAKKSPQTFAELAKKSSEDPGSAQEGGDLGFFAHGKMVKQFDDAVFAMHVGDIVGPVETQFGFHIIKLNAVKAAEGPKLETVKAQVEQELRKTEGGKRFAEAAETFSNLVYEQPDSLKAVTDELKLELQTSGWITAQGAAENPLLNNQKFLRALFSEDAVKQQRNTEAVEIAPGMLISARVIEHQPATLRPFEEVRAEILARLTHDKAVELAKREGEALVAQLQKGEADGRPWSPPQMVTRERRAGLHQEAVESVFRADSSKVPVYFGLPTPDGRYVIYRVSRIVDVETVDAEARKMLARQIEQVVGMEAETARLSGLKKRIDVEINAKAIEKSG